MAAETTRVDVEQLRGIAKDICYIVDEHKAGVHQIAQVDPNAGQFDAALWLRDLFRDRRNAAYEHMQNLERALEEISDGLTKIADEFEKVDTDNADAVAKFEAAAKDIIGGMAETEYEAARVQGQESYESGDDKETGDKDTFDNSDPNKPKILDFDPSEVPGMEEFMTLDGLGENDDKKIDFNEQDDLKGEEDFEVEDGPTADDHGARPDDDGSESESDGDSGEESGVDPDEHLNVSQNGEGGNDSGGGDSESRGSGVGGEPEEGWPGEDADKDWDDRTFRYYEIDGEHQNVSGNEIWWESGKSYIKTDDGFIRYDGDESRVEEPPGNRDYPGESYDEDWDGDTYRYYEPNGQHQTHNGNEIWWTNGKPYVRMPDDSFVPYEVGGWHE